MNFPPAHVEPAWEYNESCGAGAGASVKVELSGRVVMAGSDSGQSDNDGSGDKKDDIVITPGGPRRRDQVHPVGPGETVRRNPDGTYTVVPKPTPDASHKRPENQ
jgi:hypothetical protein